MNYDHFVFCEEMATTLKAIGHSASTPRYFKATGEELFSTLDDMLSAVGGPILIAVDSGDEDDTSNGYEGLAERRKYYVIVAYPTSGDDLSTVHAITGQARVLLKAVRNVLIARYPMFDRNCSFFGVGPFGDNFYGCALEFSMVEYPDYYVDSTLFHDVP